MLENLDAKWLSIKDSSLHPHLALSQGLHHLGMQLEISLCFCRQGLHCSESQDLRRPKP